MLDDSGVAGISLLDSGAVSDENAGVLDEDVASSEEGIGASMLDEDAADVSSAGPELFESEEQAKKTALAAVTIMKGAANLLNIP